MGSSIHPYISLNSEDKNCIISYNEPLDSNKLKEVINFFNKIQSILILKKLEVTPVKKKKI